MQENFLSPAVPVQTVSTLADLSAKCGVNLDRRNTPQAGTPEVSRHETPSLPAHGQHGLGAESPTRSADRLDDRGVQSFKRRQVLGTFPLDPLNRGVVLARPGGPLGQPPRLH